MEEFVDAVTGGAIWGVGFGLALGAVRAAGNGTRPVLKGAVRSVVGVGDWVRNASTETRESLEDIYHEARADLDDSSREKVGARARE
ncbi:MAG: hypothetical protein NVSMB2_20600 [Chloroflexota bacterium]